MTNKSLSNRREPTENIQNLIKSTMLLLEDTLNIFILLDREMALIYCSDSLISLLGGGIDTQDIGRPFLDIHERFLDQDFTQRSKDRLLRIISGEERIIEYDAINWSRLVGRRSYQITYRRLVDDGAFDGIAIMLYDVTYVRLEETEQLMSDMLHSTQSACLMWDDQGEPVDHNKEGLRLFGFPEDLPHSEYDKIISIIQPEYQEDGNKTEDIKRAFLSEVLSKGYAKTEIVLKKTDGTPIPVEVVGSRISWHYGNRVIVYFNDVTDLKAKEAEAREAEDRMRFMLDSTPLICILRDEHNNVIDCNQEALNMFGVSDKKEFCKNFYNFYPEFQPDGTKSLNKAAELLKNVQTMGTKTFTFEWTFQKSNNELMPVETTFARIPWQDSYRCLSYSRDLREAKSAEQKMKESIERTRSLELQEEKARAASEAKSQFLASMSHEIRTPMNTIIGLLDLMRIDNLDPEQKKYIHDMKAMSEVLLQIINDILDFHKIEIGKLELTPFHFNLNTFFDELVSQHQFIAESKLLEFKSNFPPYLPRSVFGDKLRIGQILTNIINNAIKYTRKGCVSFSADNVTENGQKYIAFTIEDSGIGIKEEDIGMIFDEFEQFDKRKNQGITGTGLGLSITKRLIDLMDGQIRVESKYGQGTSFIVLLPLIEGDIEQIAQAEKMQRVLARPDTKVLVVDDNTGNITVAIGLLARHGIVPHTAGNGVQALEMIKAHKYDLVFMDHMMPVMDGVKATSTIRKWEGEYYKNLPIIALSANAIAGAKEMFFNNGMNDFVAKPIRTDDLNRVLLKWLPPEKIVEQRDDLDGSEQSSEESVLNLNKLLEELRAIKDLSIVTGLSRVGGDRKLYIDILWQFCNNAEEDIEDLKTFVNKGMWKDYTIRIHALKSVFANIGNQFMSDWAYRLEAAAVQDDVDKCINETSSFCSAMNMFYNDLKATDIMGKISVKTSKTTIAPELLLEKLQHLRSACRDYHAEAAETLAKELSETTVNARADEMLEKIHDLVYSFDYDKADFLLNQLLD